MKAPWLDAAGLIGLVEYLGREVHFKVDTRHVARAHDLLLALTARGENLSSRRKTISVLSPLLCSSREEQAMFPERFNEFFPVTPRAAVSQTETEPAEKAEARERRTQRVIGAANSVALTAFLGILAVTLIYFFGPVIIGTLPELDGGTTGRFDALPQLFGLMEEVDRFSLSGLLWVYLPAISVLTLILAGLISWHHINRRRFLRSTGPSPKPEFSKIALLPGLSDVIFPSLTLIALARRLRKHRNVETRWLDVDRTVSESIRKGGWITPVFANQPVTPDYLFLVERRSATDHLAKLTDALAGRLTSEGVFIDTYYFRRDAKNVTRGRDGQRFRLEELAVLHPDHRLILVADEHTLLDPFSGELLSWTGALRNWNQRVLWTPWPAGSNRNERRALSDLLTVVPIGRNPLDGTDSAPADAMDMSRPPPLPSSFQGGAEPWLNRIPPQPGTIEAGLTALNIWLGPEAYLWLSAIAVFPKPLWPITVHLGAKLTDREGRPLIEPGRLARISLLPWMRAGSMPEWLRQRLLQDLPGGWEQEIRDTVNELLVQGLKASPQRTEETLEFTPSRSLLRRVIPSSVRKLRDMGSPNSPLRDTLFFSFVRGRGLGFSLSNSVWNWLRSGIDPHIGEEARRAVSIVRATLAVLLIAAITLPIAASYLEAAPRAAILSAAVLLGPGFALGSASYAGYISGLMDSPWKPMLIWGGTMGGTLFTILALLPLVSIESASTAGLLALSLPLLVIGLVVFVVIPRAFSRIQRLPEKAIRQRRQTLLSIWGRSRYALYMPAGLAALSLAGIFILQNRAPELHNPLLTVSLITLFVTSFYSISAASFTILPAGMQARSRSILHAGVVFQVPHLLLLGFLLLGLMGVTGRAIQELFLLAFLIYMLVAGLLVRNWRQHDREFHL